MAQAGVRTRGVQPARRNYAPTRVGYAPMERSYAQSQKTAAMNRRMFIIALALVLASLFIYVNRMAAIAGGAKTISRLRTQIAAEESRRQQLEIQLAERQSLDMIGSEAVSRLGMVRPGSWSVRVVTLPGDAASGESQTAYDAAGESATP